MSRQLRASHFTAKASTCTRPLRFVEDYEDLDGAGPSGENQIAQRQPAAAVGAFETDLYDSDWELEIDDLDNDHTWIPPKVPENLPGAHDLSDTETEVEFEEDLDNIDYVRLHDASMESVPDSDIPLAFCVARPAQVNAP